MEVSEDWSNMKDIRGCRKAAMCEISALCACGLGILAGMFAMADKAFS